MTTIVYNHKTKTIAYDSRITKGSVIVSDAREKRVLRDDIDFFCSGADSDIPELIDCYIEGRLKSERSLEANAIFVKDGNAFILICTNDLEIIHCLLQENESLGSGGEWAIAALDFGCDAVNAVEYAATKDIYTGGKINIFEIAGVENDTCI